MRPIVLLHGFTGSPSSWWRVIEALGAPLVLVPALLGHGGRHDAAAVRGFDEELDRLALLIRAASAGPAHIAGYSLGARLALGLVLRHPELFASASLIGVHPGLSHPTERMARRLIDEAWCDLLQRDGLGAFVDAWEAQPIFFGQSPEQRAAQREIRLSHSASGLIRSLRATGLGVMPCLEGALGRAEIPIDLLVGERDSKFVALAESVASSLPRPRLELVSGAGHNLLIERPDVVVRAIARGART